MSLTCQQARESVLSCPRHGLRLILAVMLSAALISPLAAEVRYGPSVTLGNGTARIFLMMDNGAPTELGVALNQAFMDALPAEGTAGAVIMPDGRSTFEFVLEMPDNNPTPFQHVTLDWNPSGHEPDGVYDLAHLDVHFYLISDAERQAIHPGDAEFLTKGARGPSPEFVPVGYVNPGAPPVPLMGTHLVDLSSPELHPQHPQTFTHTFLYGTWNGRLIFVEPMVTTAFLATRPDVTKPIGVASRYEVAGYYPDHYSVRWEPVAGEYRIALSGLKKK